MKRKILSWLVVVCLSVTFCFPAYGTETHTGSVASDIATRIEQIVAVSCSDLPGQYEIGNAVTIYNADMACVSYMIPVFCDQECVGMVEVDVAGNVTMTDNITLYTNITELPSAEYLLFASGGIVYAAFPGEILELYDSGFDFSLNDEFVSLSYVDKVEVADECFETTKSIFDISAVIEEAVMPCIVDSELALFALPPVLIETEKCLITDFVTQNGYNICWAACVATIVNYRNGDDLSAEEVATAMGHNYISDSYPGASISETVSALSLYGVNCSFASAKLTWPSLKNNIKNDRPFIIGIRATVNNRSVGHMLTGYGYSCHVGDGDMYAGSRYVTVWDPNGAQVTFQYNATSFKLTLYSWMWTWEATIYD